MSSLWSVAQLALFHPARPQQLIFWIFFTQGKCFKGIVEGESNADEFIPKLIALNQQGRFPYDQLIKFYDFADINEAISYAENGRVLKPVIRFNGGYQPRKAVSIWLA